MKPSGNNIRVVVAGSAGRMGSLACRHLHQASGIEVVGAFDRGHVGENLSTLFGAEWPALTISDKLGAMLDETKPNVLIELTHPGCACDHALSAMKRGIAVVIGTSGISSHDQTELKHHASGAPCLIVPNFAIGAVLMMQFAEIAAKWMPDVEVIEMHHAGKADAPSGTAKSTAERIGAVRGAGPSERDRIVNVEGVRGGKVKDVTVHSVRLKGFVASQECLFGAMGEILTLRHDTTDRQCFMTGIELCARKIWEIDGFKVGLDAILG